MAEELQVVAKYDYQASDERELAIKKNEKLVVLDRTSNWWKVQNQLGHSGYVPSNYLKTYKPSIFSSLRRIIRKPSRGENDSLSALSSTNNCKSGDGSDSQLVCELTQCDTFTAVVRYAYEAQKPDELSLCRGETIVVREKSSDGWWHGRSVNTGLCGWFPSNYVEVRLGDSLYHDTTSASPAPEDGSCRRRRVLPMSSIRHAVALYKFDATNEDELSFNETEEFDILDDMSPPDAGWLRARNVNGNVGLIPQEFVRVSISGDSDSPPSCAVANTASGGSLSNSSAGQGSLGAERSSSGISLSGVSRNGCAPFAGREWYFGNITRSECEELMNQFADDGDYLVRESETNVGDYTLTMKTHHRNKHFRIIVDCAGTYRIGPQLFQSLDDLVEYYTKHAIYRLGTDKLFLLKPFVNPVSDCTSTAELVNNLHAMEVVDSSQVDNTYDM